MGSRGTFLLESLLASLSTLRLGIFQGAKRSRRWGSRGGLAWDLALAQLAGGARDIAVCGCDGGFLGGAAAGRLGTVVLCWGVGCGCKD